ncbi:amidase [Vibrio mangrovi]|uniref:Amidase n=1 Tax=Vibrio mangrovi TaxID=474394 RepID=A0A1Y6IWX7_9VIBR|nr:amidase [Vibrio mangrovi]MDW6005391.1 amidase [Vibrio mangrovi]SMS02169.1 Biuret hydrolase [Vibrio mangrovi]
MKQEQVRDRRIYCQQGPDYLSATDDGALSGLSFVFKDLFDVAGYTTGAGNPAWLESHPPAKSTSPLIEALLSAGAICRGRVQTDELAYSLNGQNIHYGTPENPAAPGCIPGGSSSGSAVAVAQGDVDFSIGTDTGGSVRIPASYCGLFGLRPTLGKFDLSNCFELAKSFDTAGFFARDLPVLKSVYSELSAEKVPDFAGNIPTLYLDRLLAQQLSEDRYQRMHDRCRWAGIALEEKDFITQSDWTLDELSLLFRTIQGYEIIQKHGRWLTDNEMTLDPAILERVKWARTISDEAYEQGKIRQKAFRLWLYAQLDEHGGVWLVPTTPAGPPSLDISPEAMAAYRSELMGLTAIAGLAGFPQLHMPFQGMSDGPCGISLLGLPNEEAQLLAIASQLMAGEENI